MVMEMAERGNPQLSADIQPIDVIDLIIHRIMYRRTFSATIRHNPSMRWSVLIKDVDIGELEDKIKTLEDENLQLKAQVAHFNLMTYGREIA